MDEWCCVGVCDGGSRGSRRGGMGGADARVTHHSPANPTLAGSKCFVEVCVSRSIWLVTATVSHLRISEQSAIGAAMWSCLGARWRLAPISQSF